MLRYQPLIDALEAGEDIGFDEKYSLRPFKPGSILEKFHNDYAAKFGEENMPYMGGARDLEVMEIPDKPFRITEYDGSESVETFSVDHYFDPRNWDEIIEGEVVEERPELEPPKDIEI